MSKRRSKQTQAASPPRRRSRVWTWIALVAVGGVVVVAFTPRRSRPSPTVAVTLDRFLPTVENKNRRQRAGSRRHGVDSRRRILDGGAGAAGHARRRRDAGHDRFATDPSRRRGRLLDGCDRSDQRTVRPVREGDRIRHVRRADPARRRFPRSAGRDPRAGFSDLFPSDAPRVAR